MARLRKASPLEPSIFFQQQDQPRPRRSSPRKAVREVSYIISSDEDEENIPLRPKPSKRDLGEPSFIVQEDSFHTSKSHASPTVLPLTPRRQRILRPVESNSRLLSKLSDESLASPEKRLGSERRARQERGATNRSNADIARTRNFMYAKSLVRSVAGRELRKASSKVEVFGEAEEDCRKAKDDKTVTMEIQEIEAESEEETGLLCGNEVDVAHEAGEQQIETKRIEEATSEEDNEPPEDEDDDIILPVRSRQRRAQRCIESDSGSEYKGSEAVGEQHRAEDAQVEEPQLLVSMRPPHRKGHSTISNWAQEVIDLTDSPQAPESFVLPESTRARSSSFAISRPATSSSEGAHPFLTYSPTPTKKRSPCKAPPVARPITPPLAPSSPTKLVSPSKRRTAVSKAPELRPSLDAFWNPEVVNEWNDRHSPVKKLVSPKKQQWRDAMSMMMSGMDLEDASSDEAYTNPASSSKKKAPRPKSMRNEPLIEAGPTVKEVRVQRKDFADRKDEIASSFLAALDETICSGTIGRMSETTGGIQVIWSKTLKTTAGRANWRREVIRLKTSCTPPTYTTETRHHCSIELATKVIDESTRLYNVLAHEFCHLLTFMISEVRNNPHGAEFKAWGRKVSAAFADKGVEVTTKHSYAIDYKFVWECVSCGYEFKRHSRSVDTKRHSCGKCKGRLVQTKPAPRIGRVGKDGEGAKSEYQIFVKENFKHVKQDMAAQGLDTQMGKVMEVVARRYREQKEAEKRESEKVLDGLDEALEHLEL